MISSSFNRTRGVNRTLGALLALVVVPAFVGCDNPPDTDAGPQVDGGPPRDAGPIPDTGPRPDAGPTPVGVLQRSSRSSTIAITDDDAIVGMVNPAGGSVSFFQAAEASRLAELPTGASPSSIVIHGTTAYVANRGDATVVRIEGIDTASPTIAGTVNVGAEPTGLALTPTGATLFVAEHAEGSIGVIDTASMARTDSIDAPQNPFALAVTNDRDTEDDDELLIAPEFFGTPTGIEGQNDSREGLVRVYRVSDLEPDGPITLAGIDSGFGPDGEATHVASPNQLHSVTIQEDRIYVTSTSVSPGAPVRFNLNVHPVVYVADIPTRTEIRSGAGSVNLARRVGDATADSKLFLADTVDLAFIGNSGGVAYAASRGADAVQRVVFDVAGDGITIGSTQNLQIDVNAAPAGEDAGCQNPTGIATANGGPRAFLNCWQTRQLGVVDLSTQALIATQRSTAAAENAEVARGARFFHTGRARWSDNSWSSCSSCHPGGLTDNVTWAFAAGPRQTTSLDGSFSHGPGAQVQRVFNWTAVFDEIHDFERNTRGVSGGLGAVTNGDCSSPATESPAALAGGVGQPVKEVADAADSCVPGEWDAIDAWVRTIEPPQGRRFADAAAVARGAELFGMPDASNNNGGCVACHGGPGWTASRRFFVPSSANNTALTTAAFTPPAMWPASWNSHAFEIEAQPAAEDADPNAAGPPHIACVIRDVDSFGVPGDGGATDTLEVRANGNRAQGAGGYNVPSLYGLTVGAPYLHHGGAATLEGLFTSARWENHTRAMNPAFLTTGDVDADRAALIAFLESIDATTVEQPLPAGFDGCTDR